MSDDDTRIDALHRYLSGEMDATETTAFEARLQSDPQLQADLQLERELQALIRYERKMQLKQMLRDTPVDFEQPADQDLPKDATPPSLKKGGGLRPPFLKYIYAISAIAACVIAAVMVFRGFGEDGFERKIDLTNPIVLNDFRTDRAIGKRDRALEYMDEGNWSQAKPYLDTVKTDSERIVLRGICNMNLENWKAAREDFQKVEEMQVGKFSTFATWYLALMDWKEEHLEDCKRRLEVVVVAGDVNLKIPRMAKDLQKELGFSTKQE